MGKIFNLDILLPREGKEFEKDIELNISFEDIKILYSHLNTISYGNLNLSIYRDLTFSRVPAFFTTHEKEEKIKDIEFYKGYISTEVII